MRRTLRTMAAALAALVLSACTSHGVSASSSVVSAPAIAQDGGPQALSPYEMLIRDAHGQLTRAHIFLPRDSNAPQATGGNLQYRGGRIQAVPVIFVVYWQFPHFGDPSGEKSILHNFYSGVGGSSWLNTDTQYYGPVGTFISNPSGQLAGEWVDTANPIPLTVTASSIASEALRAEAHFGYSFNAAYVIATPHGDSMNGFGTVWCGWHASESSSSGSVAFTNVPYITDAASCGANFNNLGPKAGITIVSGHEEAETQTDPNPPYGWTDNNGAEIGDKCEWIKTGHRGAARTITLSTGTFAVQSLWDNAFNGDSGGCVISGP